MIDVLWNATLYCLVNSSQHFEGLYCFQKFRNTATEHNSFRRPESSASTCEIVETHR